LALLKQSRVERHRKPSIARLSTVSNSCQATTIKAGLPLIWARVSRAELGPLIKVGRGRRGQGVFDLKVEVERLCEEEEAEPTHWDEGLDVIASMVQSLLAKLRASLGEKEYASKPIIASPTPSHSQCICLLHIPLDQDKGDPRWTSQHLPHPPLFHLSDYLRHQLWL